MKLKQVSCAVMAVALLPSWMVGADTTTKAAAPQLSAAQIVEKNVAARGGLAGWRSLQTIEMKGKMQAGGNKRATLPSPGAKLGNEFKENRPNEQVELPFVLRLARGRKQRWEIQFNGQTAIQVYDGSQGWKLRPFLNRHQVEKYTADELKRASSQADIDGLLIDYTARGSKVELEGVEQVEGRKAYNLRVTDRTGNVRHDWVDAASFLELKVEGDPRRLDGKFHPVATYLRDYRSVNGLMMPYLVETVVEGVKDSEKIKIEEIVSNPKIDGSQFAMPQ